MLLKVVRIISLFRPLPIRRISLQSRCMNNPKLMQGILRQTVSHYESFSCLDVQKLIDIMFQKYFFINFSTFSCSIRHVTWSIQKRTKKSANMSKQSSLSRSSTSPTMHNKTSLYKKKLFLETYNFKYAWAAIAIMVSIS